MTAAVAANPALASLALALAPAASPAGTGMASPPAGTPTAAGSSPFTALLLGLRPASATVAATAVDPATAPGTATLPLATESAVSLPGLAPAGASPRLAGAQSGNAAGEYLPDGGMDLPLADLTALLASLDESVGPVTTTTPFTPATHALPPGAVPVTEATTTGESTAGPPASAAPGTIAGSPSGLAVMQLREGSGTDATLARQGDRADAAPASDAVTNSDSAKPERAADSDARRGMDLGLPADFRARLDAALALASRPAISPDASVSGANPFASSPLTSTSSYLPAGATNTLTDSLPDYLPALQPLADRSAWAQGLGERLMMLADQGLQTATLRLQPEHLGPVEVKINVDENGAAQVLFSAHHAQTRDALEAAMPRLRELFAEQGLSLTQANVDTGSSAFAQRGFAAQLPSWGRWSQDDTDARADEVAGAWRLARPSNGRVDVLV